MAFTFFVIEEKLKVIDMVRRSGCGGRVLGAGRAGYFSVLTNRYGLTVPDFDTDYVYRPAENTVAADADSSAAGNEKTA